MGQTKSKECADKKGTDNLLAQDAEYDINILRRLSENEGLIAVSEYIDKSLHRWKKEQVKFAITGRSATGKSTFINTIRNLKPGMVVLQRQDPGTRRKRQRYIYVSGNKRN